MGGVGIDYYIYVECVGDLCQFVFDIVIVQNGDVFVFEFGGWIFGQVVVGVEIFCCYVVMQDIDWQIGCDFQQCFGCYLCSGVVVDVGCVYQCCIVVFVIWFVL